MLINKDLSYWFKVKNGYLKDLEMREVHWKIQLIFFSSLSPQ